MEDASRIGGDEESGRRSAATEVTTSAHIEGLEESRRGRRARTRAQTYSTPQEAATKTMNKNMNQPIFGRSLHVSSVAMFRVSLNICISFMISGGRSIVIGVSDVWSAGGDTTFANVSGRVSDIESSGPEIVHCNSDKFRAAIVTLRSRPLTRRPALVLRLQGPVISAQCTPTPTFRSVYTHTHMYAARRAAG